VRPPRIPFVYPRTEPPEVARLRERVDELEAEVEQLCDGIASLFQALWPVGPLTWINADALRTATERAVALAAAEQAVKRVRAAVPAVTTAATRLVEQTGIEGAAGVLVLAVAGLERALDTATPNTAAPDA
jgi:hypothetical protein